jgi:catechol 2,3-dioxygenase
MGHWSQPRGLGEHPPVLGRSRAPRHLIGVGAPRVEHALLATDDVRLADRFFCEVLDFYATERVQTSLDDDCQYIGTWLSAGNQVHDIAFIDGPPGKLHHFAFQLKDWSEILRAGQLFAMDDVYWARGSSTCSAS